MKDESRASFPAPSYVMIGATSYFTLHFVLAAFYQVHFVAGTAEIPSSWGFLLTPGILLTASVILTWMHLRAVAIGPFWLRPVTVALMGTVAFLHSLTPWSWEFRRLLLVGLFALLASLLAFTGRRVFGRPQPGKLWVLLTTVVVGSGLIMAFSSPISNRFGLVCFKSESTEMKSYDEKTNKDNYPPCTFEYNSLGYRDIEQRGDARGRRRVLLIGDSYVWGDGIPSNEETLGYRLREALEARSPAGFDVISAAFPGIDLYGYVRFTKVLQPHFDADIVIISTLGDCWLSDTQYLVDQAPDIGSLRRLLAMMSVLQRAHEFAASINEDWRNSPAGVRFCRHLLEELAQHTAEGGYELLFLNYDKQSQPKELEAFQVLDLPQHWKYQGTGNELWYAMDEHPKPHLLRLVADILAERIVRMGTRPGE